TLVWGFGSQEVGIAATPFSVSFLVRPRVFLRPDHDCAERRAQPRSRLAGTALTQRGASHPGHALTAARTARGLTGGMIHRSRDRWQDVILDWATNDACGKLRITLYSVRDESPGPQSFMHGRRQGPERRDPSTKRV